MDDLDDIPDEHAPELACICEVAGAEAGAHAERAAAGMSTAERGMFLADLEGRALEPALLAPLCRGDDRVVPGLVDPDEIPY